MVHLMEDEDHPKGETFFGACVETCCLRGLICDIDMLR